MPTDPTDIDDFIDDPPGLDLDSDPGVEADDPGIQDIDIVYSISGEDDPAPEIIPNPQRPEDRIETPTNLLEFHKLFPDERACIDYLIRLRWPQGFTCPTCGGQGWVRHDRRSIECNKGHDTSLTANTAMHRSRQSLTLWFHAAYLVSTLTPGISALQFQRQLGIKRYETAFQMLHKLRSALVAPAREPLHGEVQVDEGFIGGEEEGRPGRGAQRKALVVFAVEVIRFDKEIRRRESGIVEIEHRTRGGRIRASVISNAKKETLIPWVEKNVAVGSKIVTDGHAGYVGLTEKGYIHIPLLQSHKGKPTGDWLPLVHLIVSNLKRWLMGTHKGAVRRKHLQAYLNEFVFRFNRRFWRGPAFLRVLGFMNAAEEWPEYNTLYQAGEEKGWVHPNGKVHRHQVAEIIDEVRMGADPMLTAWMDRWPETVKKLVREEVRTFETAGGS